MGYGRVMGQQSKLGAADGPGSQPGADAVFHIARAEDWAQAQATMRYAGSALCRADGFIHLSSAHQVAGTLRRFFADADDLVLLMAETADLGERLKWEPASDGDVYPHFYGEIDVGRLRVLGPIARDGAGNHVLPVDLGAVSVPAGRRP
jgi:uncharacterized protein (DUF952 family)